MTETSFTVVNDSCCAINVHSYHELLEPLFTSIASTAAIVIITQSQVGLPVTCIKTHLLRVNE